MDVLLWSWSLLAPLALGELVLRCATFRARNAWLRASLAAGLGMGCTAVLFFAWIMLGGRRVAGLFAVEAAALAACASCAWALRNRAAHAADAVEPSPAPPPNASTRWLRLAVVLAVLLALVDFAVVCLHQPHGDGDSMAIWNARAIYLLRAPGEWSLAFSPLMDAADYPVLLPCLVARGWMYAGTETVLVPMLVGAVFTWATVGLLCGALQRVRTPNQSSLGVLALLATPWFIRQGAAQMADVPIAFWFLGVVFLLGERGAGERVLAGTMAALAAFTKNEGLVFAVLAVLMHLAVRRRERLQFLAGAVLPGLAVAWFALALSPGNGSLREATWQTAAQLVDPARLALVLRHFAASACAFGIGDATPGNGLAAMLVLAAVLGRARPSPAPRLGGWLLGAMLVADFGVYVLAPSDPTRILHSVPRVLLQLWPAFLFLLLSRLRGVDGPSWERAGSS